MTATGKWAGDYVYLNGRLLAKVVPEPKTTGPPADGLDAEVARLPVDGPPDGGGKPVKLDIYYYHLDHLGTPVAMTDASKTIVWSTDYYPFGTTLDEMVVQDNEFRFPGQYHDRETDLYYNWHRYYDSKTGRYTTRDPIGLAGADMNLYRYARANSLAFSDSRGLDWWKDEDGYHWYPPEDPPIGQGMAFVADDLHDICTGEIIPPEATNYFIPIGDSEWSDVWDRLSSHFSIRENRNNYTELARCALSSDDLGMNLKGRTEGAFGRRYDYYTCVNGFILQNQDWGNLLFGAMGKRAGFNLWELRAGAGVAQILEGNWNLGDIEHWFDDPRDQTFIEAGFTGRPPIGLCQD